MTCPKKISRCSKNALISIKIYFSNKIKWIEYCCLWQVLVSPAICLQTKFRLTSVHYTLVRNFRNKKRLSTFLHSPEIEESMMIFYKLIEISYKWSPYDTFSTQIDILHNDMSPMTCISQQNRDIRRASCYKCQVNFSFFFILFSFTTTWLKLPLPPPLPLSTLLLFFSPPDTYLLYFPPKELLKGGN